MADAQGRAEWFEDYRPGDVFESGPVAFDAAGIDAFARAYDPQPIHIDPAAAAASPYGGIIAPGLMVVSACWGEMIRSGFMAGRALGAGGIDALRWLRPVRAGDTLVLRATVASVRPSDSRTDRGYVTFDFEAVNQNGEPVMTKTITQIIPRRPAGA
jgi:acyl dehydratase